VRREFLRVCAARPLDLVDGQLFELELRLQPRRQLVRLRTLKCTLRHPSQTPRPERSGRMKVLKARSPAGVSGCGWVGRRARFGLGWAP